ncbi:FAD-binding domain-containing protein [Gymnopilus junonius]|uniref:FAD-binding domain-containing protein n=1 Tax=Gymnopilus junonius TaxID=109634 RepID=A0A9P5NPU3_GYMJU|nr:FAD-binding domain-containing protein [Gymnopilus junonius]
MVRSFFKVNAALTALYHVAYSRTAFGSVASPAFIGLNNSLGGRLQVGVPWSEPCFRNFNGRNVALNATGCALVETNYFNSHLVRTDFFGAYSAIQWESCMSTGDQCMLDWLDPVDPAAINPPASCKQGSVPPVFIDVENSNDVVEAFNFARNTGITLVIKNTGHDFKGRSSAPNSLALWVLMCFFAKMTFIPRFVPESCDMPEVSAITIAAGVQFADLVPFADSHGVEIIAGSDEGVGPAGGYLQGGGHSVLTPTLGMGADRVLQYTIVTPDGAVRKANGCQNSDLFFALRGGGGGTFGVVMDATVLATPRRSYQVASINWPVSDNNLKHILTTFVDNATSLATAGWGGFLTPTAGELVLVNPTLTAQQAQDALKPLTNLAISLGGTASITPFSSFAQWFSDLEGGQLGIAQDSVGLPNAVTSRLIPEANHRTEGGRAQLVNALMNAFNNTIFSQILFTTPFGFKGSNGSDTSVNPVWRTSLYHVVFVNTWLFNSTLADRQGAYATSTTAVNFLREITPNSGAYHNEADIHEPNFKGTDTLAESFWGIDLYDKLLQIKNKYDPKHILDCWNCIGWKGANSPQYACYI